MSPAAGGLYVERTGSGEPPLVLLHGFGGSNYSWNRWVPRLRERFELHLVELKGFGRASNDPEGGFGPEEQSRLLRRYLEEQRLERPVLVGHSLGAGVALLTALALQDAGRPPVGLVLISAAVYPQAIPPFIRVARIPLVGEVFFALLPPRLLMRMALRRITRAPGQVRPEQVEAYARPLEGLRGRFTMIRAARQLLPEKHEEFVARLGEIECPALLIWGDADPVIPLSAGRRLAGDLSHAELVVLEGCGHLPAEECADRSLEAALRFLERL